MNANSLKNLRPYQPGQSGFAGRKHQLPEDLRGIKSLSRLEVTKLISRYARMTADEITIVLEERKVSILELAFCSIFINSLEKGDFTRIAFLIEQSVGKVPNSVQDDEDDVEREQLAKLSLKEILHLASNNINPETKED